MVRVVALDSSTWWSGVALVEGGHRKAEPRLVAEVGLEIRDSHAVHLVALVADLLARAGWPRSSVDAWAATRGPGSFTGLRVGLGTVRGLALGSGRPCLGIGTLVAMAEAFGPTTRDRVPLLDAGRAEVFGARFDPDGRPPVERIAPWIGPPERALEGGPEGVIFGSGAETYADRIARAGWQGRIEKPRTGVAAATGRLALYRLAAGTPSGDGMSPLYLRPPDAELKTRKR